MLHIIMDRERSYTGTVAAFLRIEITGKIFFCCRFPQSQSCPFASVAVIFIRTESVILEIAKLFFHLEVQCKNRHIGHTAYACIIYTYAQLSVKVCGIGYSKRKSRNTGSLICECDFQSIFLFQPGNGFILCKFACCIPLCKIVRLGSTGVIVRHCSPEADLWCACDILKTIVFQRTDAALFFVEHHGEVFSVNTNDNIAVYNYWLLQCGFRNLIIFHFKHFLCKGNFVSCICP